ncbi:MAG: T9SS type A sorting domain-containing protein, partial [Bacteroidales bacterium]|nr:T9SS type A sorting domain-containing protein [Bacteroidales bacterium]
QPLVAAGGNDPYAQWVEILSLNFGDVNGSNIPSAKATPRVRMEQEGVMSLEEEEEFEIPVKVVGDMEIGSVSLVIHSLQAGLVREVRMAEGLGGILSWSVEGNELRIGWYSLEAVDMRAGSELFQLVFARESAAALAGLRLEVRDNSELSNGAGEVYDFVKLSFPGLMLTEQETSSLSIWPNPVNELLHISLSLETAGQTSLQLLDVTGRLIKVIQNGNLESGNHSWQLNVSELPAGTYILTSQTQNQTYSRKVIITD